MPLERIATRNAEVGDGLIVRRALPSKLRRMVGAWCFLDHLGPVDYAAGGGLTVGPHPHIGLQTFTWMIEGEVILEKSDADDWKVFDVIVAGVSLVTNYRSSFAQEIRTGGVDGLIKSLEAKNRSLEAAQTQS